MRPPIEPQRIEGGRTYAIGAATLFDVPSGLLLTPVGYPFLIPDRRWHFGLRDLESGSVLMLTPGFGEASRELAGTYEQREAVGRGFDALVASVRPSPPRAVLSPPLPPEDASVEARLAAELLAMFSNQIVSPGGLQWETSAVGLVTLAYPSRVPFDDTVRIFLEQTDEVAFFTPQHHDCRQAVAPLVDARALTCVTSVGLLVIDVRTRRGDPEFPTAVEITLEAR